eukprot:TRINITY_DN80320_c0_g1_i1.p1 TRINITY_DN80320_c0_g1~~TRINITY_DN80320_c0_g1_i1.p1  ORF type:complete len:362 (+),score=50.50 TRINITY_DN80320_c0_g1_i1:22-1086(+)
MRGASVLLQGMRAVTLPKPGGVENMVLVTRDVPQLKRPDDVLVKVAACGICYRDVLDRKGAFPFIKPGIIMGHEVAGVVSAVGPAVRSLSVGQRVVSLHWAPCGTCRPCKEVATPCDTHHESFFGLTADGGYADYLASGASAFVPVPDGWTAVEAAPVACTYGTVWRAAVTRGGLKPGERVAITGASGGVGSAAVQLASKLGCDVIAITSNPQKEDFLRGLGASTVVVSDRSTPFFKHAALRGGVDVVLENVGEPTFQASLRSLRPNGRLVLVGNVTNASAQLPLGLSILKSLSVIGSDSVTAPELRETFAFLDKHKLRPHIHRVVGMEDAGTAHTLLEEKGVTGRVVMKLREW